MYITGSGYRTTVYGKLVTLQIFSGTNGCPISDLQCIFQPLFHPHIGLVSPFSCKCTQKAGSGKRSVTAIAERGEHWVILALVDIIKWGAKSNVHWICTCEPLKGHSQAQVERMLQASWDRGGKQQQELNSPNLGPTLYWSPVDENVTHEGANGI